MDTPKDPRIVFEPLQRWGRLPHGVTFRNDATSVAVDSEDNVYVFNRGPTPMVILDVDGNFLDSWGAGDFDRPHSVRIDSDDNLFLIDDGGHFVQKRRRDGQVLMTLGERGSSAPPHSGGRFNRPTDIAFGPDGELFVSDGYANSVIHKFDRSGKHILTWGEPGSEPGQFSLPHNLCRVGDRLVVCDRENFRLQIFDLDGGFVDQWHVHRPMSVVPFPGDEAMLVVGEMGPIPLQEGVPNLGHRVIALDTSGRIVGRGGGPQAGSGLGRLVAPHGLAVDSTGALYVAEVAWTAWYSRAEPQPIGEVRSLSKWMMHPSS